MIRSGYGNQRRFGHVFVTMTGYIFIVGWSLGIPSLANAASLDRPVELDKDNPPPAECAELVKVPIPVKDLPTEQERAGFKGCDAESAYESAPVTARKCAYLERVGEGGDMSPFSGSGLLMMIYANGMGVERNFDLAMRFACEYGGAPAESAGRIETLKKYRRQKWQGNDYSICDDITSGYMAGHCTARQVEKSKADRSGKYDQIIAGWKPAERQAWSEFSSSARSFFTTVVDNEVDLSGTARAAMQSAREDELDTWLLESLKGFEAGKLPAFSPAAWKKTDKELNTVYQKIMRQKKDRFLYGTVTQDDIKTTQRAWLTFREALVRFGKVRYSQVAPDTWRAWATKARSKQLKVFLD
jgi:hypothetical protein